MDIENPKPHEVEQAAARLRRGPESIYAAVSRPRQGGKTSELEAMKEDVQVATMAQHLHQAEKHTTSFTHNLGFHRQIAQRLYLAGIRYVPEDQGTGTNAPEDLPDEDLPGMWEKADFMGGESDTAYPITPERLITELRRRASFPKDTPDRAFLISIRYLFRQAADTIERLQRGR